MFDSSLRHQIEAPDSQESGAFLRSVCVTLSIISRQKIFGRHSESAFKLVEVLHCEHVRQVTDALTMADAAKRR